MRTDSLRRQLLNRLLWPLAAMLLLGGGIGYTYAIRTAINAYDLELLDNALDISRLVALHDGSLTLDLPPVASQMLSTSIDDHVSYAAWTERGILFAGDPKLKLPDALVFDENHVSDYIRLHGENNRVTVLRGELEGHVFYIAVAQTLHGRNRLTRGIFFSLLLPEALIALISIIAVLVGVQRGLLPVEKLRDEIASRTPSDLKPIEENTAPAELAPIIHGINDLLHNLSRSFASHRRFIADASHQLRTPLAALSSQIEVALNTRDLDSQALLQQLLAATRRTSHLASQLLSLSRLEHADPSQQSLSAIDLPALITDLAGDFVSLGANKQVELEFRLIPATVYGNPLMLRELVSNLLDNAVRYTTAGGSVQVNLRQHAGKIVLEIADNGPGVPDEELEKLGTPFHRLPSGHADGCGLGLAIVYEIARLHQAQLSFANIRNGHGLIVSLEFNSNPA